MLNKYFSLSWEVGKFLEKVVTVSNGRVSDSARTQVGQKLRTKFCAAPFTIIMHSSFSAISKVCWKEPPAGD